MSSNAPRTLVAVLLLSAPLALGACASTTPTETPDEPTSTVAPAATTAPTTAPDVSASAPIASAAPSASTGAPKRFAFVVSFFSPGNGTDRAAFDKLNALVAKLPVKVAQVSGRWGKEGEHDECFELTELDGRQKADFIAQVKKEVGASDRVRIEENAACQSTR